MDLGPGRSKDCRVRREANGEQKSVELPIKEWTTTAIQADASEATIELTARDETNVGVSYCRRNYSTVVDSGSTQREIYRNS